MPETGSFIPAEEDLILPAYPTPPIPTTYPVTVDAGDRAELLRAIADADGNGNVGPAMLNALYGKAADAILAAGYHR
jgi:hypothetical protein